MKRNQRLLALVFGLGFLALAGYHYANRARYQANAQLLAEAQEAKIGSDVQPFGRLGDWPQWRGNYRDGTAPDIGLLTEWPSDGPPKLWEIPIGLGFSSMAVADGRLYTQMQVDEEEVVLCLDADSGKEKWRFGYPAAYRVDRSYGPCPRATPTIQAGRLYTVGGNGMLHCLNAGTGKPIWQHDLIKEFQGRQPQWGVAFSPLIDGELVIAHPGGPDGNSIVAFNKHDGKLVWNAGDDPPGYSSPITGTIAGRRQLLMFTGNALVGLEPTTGQVLWRFPWNTDHDCNVATPIIRGDYVLISSGYGKGCALLKVAGREVISHVQHGKVVAGPGRNLGFVFSVEPVYESNEMCNHFSSNVLYREYVYGFSDYTLTCMEFRTGKVAWTKRGFARGSLLIADGRLIIFGESGELALADATPEEYRQRASYRFSRKSHCWSTPVLAQGKLYIRDEEKLACFQLTGR
jgi:outer membrane protein assembly factor BamB